MKKFICVILALTCAFSLAGCTQQAAVDNAAQKVTEIGPAHANEYLTEFFSSYSDMSDYISREDIALSTYTLKGVNLPSLLKASYQAQSVTYNFDVPVKTGENTFTCTLTVTAPDMNMLYEAYLIDYSIDPETDIVNSFYANINSGATTSVTSDVITLNLTYLDGTWSISSNNALVYSLFPNIGMINA